MFWLAVVQFRAHFGPAGLWTRRPIRLQLSCLNIRKKGIKACSAVTISNGNLIVNVVRHYLDNQVNQIIWKSWSPLFRMEN